MGHFFLCALPWFDTCGAPAPFKASYSYVRVRVRMDGYYILRVGDFITTCYN